MTRRFPASRFSLKLWISRATVWPSERWSRGSAWRMGTWRIRPSRPKVSKIDPLPRRIAVYGHMLKQPRLRFLLADDAGAGKTIMTGLYIREMLARRLIQRILIVPPTVLVGNWQNELSELFGMEFSVLTGAELSTRKINPFSSGPNGNRVICSMDTLRGERAFLRLTESSVLPFSSAAWRVRHTLCSSGGHLDLQFNKCNFLQEERNE